MATLNFPDNPTTGDTYTDSNSGFSYEWNGTVWISTDPSTASNIREIDDISGDFDNSETDFTLKVAAVNVEPVNAQQLIISLGGVMQNAGDDFTVSGSTITFTTAPQSGLSFFGTLLGTALSLNTIANGSVGSAALKTEDFTIGGSGNTVTIPGNLTVQGTETIINTERLDIQDKTVGIASTNAPSSTSQDDAGIIIYGQTDVNILYDIDKASLGISTAVTVTGFITANGVSTNDIITARAADTNGNSVINILSEGTTGNSRIAFSDTAGLDGWVSYNHQNRRIGFAAAGTAEKVYITSDGNLGIGTDSPNFSSFGSSTGGLEISDVTTNNALLVQSSTNEFYFANTPSANYIWGDDNVPIVIATNDTERLRVTPDGALGVGTDSPQQSSYPSIHLHGGQDDDARISITTPTKPSSRIGYFGLSNRFGMDVYNGFQIRDVGASYGTRLLVTSDGDVGIKTDSPDARLSVLAENSNTPPFVIQNPDNDENFTIATYHDSNGIYGTIGANYKLNSGGSAVVDTTDHRTAGIFFDARNNGNISFETNSAGNQPAERLRITQNGGFSFNNAQLVERVEITAGKLSNNTDIDLADGMVHYFSTTETTTSTPNIRIDSSNTLNNAMDTGDVITVTLITTAAAAAYSAALNIDSSSATVEWSGAAAPSAGGASGLDVYAYTIIKTGSGAYKVLGNYTNFD